MIYVHPLLLSEHWWDIVRMTQENYEDGYDDNDVLIVGYCCFCSVDEIKKQYPGFRRYIVYQLEPLCEGHWFRKDKIIENMEGADEIWEYDLNNLEVLRSYGLNPKFRPFTYSENLKRVANVPDEDKDIDILFYGSLTTDRLDLINKITCHGITTQNFVNVSNMDGIKLDSFIGRSKIILDLQTESEIKIQKQSRIYYALINNRCVISERSHYNYFGNLIVEVERDKIVETLLRYIDEGLWKKQSDIVSERFKKFREDTMQFILSDNDKIRSLYDVIHTINDNLI